jgi:hypothetical protein
MGVMDFGHKKVLKIKIKSIEHIFNGPYVDFKKDTIPPFRDHFFFLRKI